MSDLQEFKDHFILLCEAGFIAVNQADEDAAKKLFSAAKLLNSENTLPKVGEGYMHMMKLELKDACNCFTQVIEKEPTNEMSKAFLGLSYALTETEMSKGEKILEEAAKESIDDGVKTLAGTALDFVNKFLKKAPTPAEKPTEGKKKKKK